MLLLLGGMGLQAQSISVQLVENSESCETNMYCADVQIKGTSLNDGLIGNSSIRFNYNPQVLSFFGTNTSVTTGSYTSRAFDNQYECELFGTSAKPYEAHSFDGTVSGDFLLTVLLENWIDQYQCAGLEDDWVSLSTVCFEVLDASADPQLKVRGTENGVIADFSGTNFNSTTNNPADKYENGDMKSLNATMDEICDGTASGIDIVGGNFGWTIDNISPMPATDDLFVSLNMNETGKVQTQIFDLNGRLIMEQNDDVSEGKSQIQLDVRAIPAGAYLVSVSKGSEVQAGKLIKE